MAKRKRYTQSDIKKDLEWRKVVLSLIVEWANNNNQGPIGEREIGMLASKVNDFSRWLQIYLPWYWPSTISEEDAALLIILPSAQALKLARRIFRSVVTPDGLPIPVLNRMESEDLVFNIDWFRPREIS